MTLEFSVSRRAARRLPPRMGAVYILLLKDQPMYVGATKDLRTRIAGHTNTSCSGYRERLGMSFDFDRIEWKPLQTKPARLAYEAAVARALNPLFTFRVLLDTTRDRVILRSLGITEYRADEFRDRIAAHYQSGSAFKRECLRAWHLRDRVERVFAFIEAA